MPEGHIGNAALVDQFFAAVSQLAPAVFCDIGANKGDAAIRAKMALPNAAVHAFEANPKIHAAFGDKPVSMGIGWHNLAVTSRLGPVDIYVPRRISRVLKRGRLLKRDHRESEDTGKGSLLRRNEDADYDHHVVSGVTLDGFLAEAAPTGDAALWVDVEGAASLVLDGAAKTLERTQIILVEVEGYKFWEGQSGASEVFQKLIPAGFTPVHRDREYGDFQCNVLFIRNDLLPDFRPAVSYSEQGDVPALVPCFNNPTYSAMMLDQLWRVGFRDIRFIDNASTNPDMQAWLDREDGRRKVVRLNDNLGPGASMLTQNDLPRHFCVTDPDISFNPNLPSDFLIELRDLTHRHAIGKAGFALDLSRRHLFPAKTFPLNGRDYTVSEWEEPFWQHPLRFTAGGDRVFDANVDTTFCMVDRRFFIPDRSTRAVRIAGRYTATHLPWEGAALPPEREMSLYAETQRHSNYGV
ncbi:hypothetical protein ASD64_07045 [Mesorhizobium sp. Root157]|nr:hypothetical protein ASD64_07045 [Mesorhizobium sp. Root157]